MLSTDRLREAEAVAIAVQVEEEFGFTRPGAYKNRPIDFIDPAPQPFEVEISLVEYFERITRHKADRWQHHFCQYLQDAAVNRSMISVQAIVHAQARLGKSRILAQTYPAWLLGHDPLHRIALATYNKTQSEGHSEAVVSMMNLPIHKEIFPNPDGWVDANVAKDRWRTAARKSTITDTERSFNAVGLQSGLTGAGFDTLIIDDPYADAAEAFSPTVRKKLTNHFWEFTVKSRIGLHSNVFGMFHRYHMEDLAGYLLDTGKFDYLRYASIADGDYVHIKTGQRFADPLDRAIGEYISERFGAAYYKDKKDNPQVWNSMFQGKPTSEAGDFFHVDKIRILKGEELAEYRKKCVIWIRSWDNAATKDAGDHTAGALIGMHPDGAFLVEDMKLAQLDPAARMELQKETAKADGADVTITVPKEVGEAGKSLVFFAQQYLRGFQVKGRSVVNSENPGDTAKKRRAWNLSIGVNSCQGAFASDAHLPDEKKWVSRVIEAMRAFGFTSFDDPIDAMADAYNEAHEQINRGLIMRNFSPQRNLIGWKRFAKIYGEKVPKAWQVYVGVKLTNEQNAANSALIVARASQNTGLEDTLFVIAEYKRYTANFYELFDWIESSLVMYCERPKAALISIDKESSDKHGAVIRQRLKLGVAAFDQDELAGATEANHYMKERAGVSPFNTPATGLYALVADDQLIEPIDELGLYNFRQEAATWGYNDKGEPTKLGSVLDCLRMTTFRFRTMATGLTQLETVERAMPKAYTIAEMLKKTGKKHLTDTQQIAREVMEQEVREQLFGTTERERPDWAEDFIEDGKDLEKWERSGGY